MSQVKDFGTGFILGDNYSTTQESIKLPLSRTKDEIKGIIFDFDGVLISFEIRFGWPFLQTIKKVKPDIKREEITETMLKAFNYMTCNKHIKRKDFMKFLFFIGENLGLTKIQLIKMLLIFSFQYKKNNGKLVPQIGVREVLRELLASEYQIALVTNSRRKTIEKAMEIIPELKEFDIIITTDDVENAKPNPEGFKRVLQYFKLEPHEVLSIGDQASDLVVGNKVGTKTVAISYEYMNHLKEHFLEYNPNYLLDDLRDLPLLITLGKYLNRSKQTTIDLTEETLLCYNVSNLETTSVSKRNYH